MKKNRLIIIALWATGFIMYKVVQLSDATKASHGIQQIGAIKKETKLAS
jgi:hypothetical protein